MKSNEMKKKFEEWDKNVALFKYQFNEAKKAGDKQKRLEVRALLRAAIKERNYYKKQMKLAEKAGI